MNNITRRVLIEKGSQCLGALAFGSTFFNSCKDDSLFSRSNDEYYIKQARHWKKLNSNTVQCSLCPNECVIEKGDRGICRVRKNIDGKLNTIVYSRIAASHVDPVEKKPLYHFLPGSLAYSIATAGCNLSCKFCQNWQLSQSNPEDLDAEEISPADLSTKAKKSASKIIAYTYNEPTVQYEYILDSSSYAKKMGLRPVIISNGFIKEKASRELVRNLDGIKIDLKAFSDKFYKNICGGDLKGVLKNLENVYSSGKWLEIVVLVIPTLNDSAQEIHKMTRWVKTNLSPDVPMHFTRFHSMYKIRNLPPTPVKTLERCRIIANQEGIRYPYVGNVPGHKWENTYCHKCGKPLIKRSGFFHVKNNIKNGRCPYCKISIPGVWN